MVKPKFYDFAYFSVVGAIITLLIFLKAFYNGFNIGYFQPLITIGDFIIYMIVYSLFAIIIYKIKYRKI